MAEKKIETADLGDVVIYYPDGDESRRRPHVAIVTRINEGSVGLHFIGQTKRDFKIMEGVRHLADPRAVRTDAYTAGAWEHTPQTRERRRLLAMVEKLLPKPKEVEGKT